MRGGVAAVPLSFFAQGRDVARTGGFHIPLAPACSSPGSSPGAAFSPRPPLSAGFKTDYFQAGRSAPPERSPRYLVVTLYYIITGPGGCQEKPGGFLGANSHFVYGTPRKPAQAIENTGFQRVRSVFQSGFSLMFSLYRFITSLMKLSIRAALSRFMRSVTWPYLSSVKAAVAWPRLPCTVLISSPARIAFTA